jgi:erythritol kinase
VRSAEWTQIFADVLGRPIVIPTEPGIGARGAVLTAAAALSEPIDVDAWTANARTVQVRPQIAEVYERGYAEYLDSLASARQRWSR